MVEFRSVDLQKFCSALNSGREARAGVGGGWHMATPLARAASPPSSPLTLCEQRYCSYHSPLNYNKRCILPDILLICLCHSFCCCGFCAVLMPLLFVLRFWGAFSLPCTQSTLLQLPFETDQSSDRSLTTCLSELSITHAYVCLISVH